MTDLLLPISIARCRRTAWYRQDGAEEVASVNVAATEEADFQRRKQRTANRIFNSLRACLNHA
jgi:hypothetical protein